MSRRRSDVKNFGFPAAISATALATTLVAFPFRPLSRADEPEPQRVAAEEATNPTVLPPEPRPPTGEKTERAAHVENANRETEQFPKVSDALHTHGSR